MKLSDTECQNLSAYFAVRINKSISLTGGTNVLSMPHESGWSCVGAVPKSHKKHGRLGKYELAQRAYEAGYRTGRNAARVFKIEGKNTCRKYTE